MSSWNVPEISTRTGASHARRGVVCQDASGRQSLKNRSGQPVQLMVVADGHGGKRYIHSDVGSRLACELSLTLVAEKLGHWGTDERGAKQRWQEWLEATFPKTLHQRWLAAVETHWRKQGKPSERDDVPYSPLAYGTTIALVVMTPTWWAHTGVGDWDLVRITADGEVELLNEEQEEDQTGGEATYSLCLDNAPHHFAARTGVHAITEQQSSFSLMLSTDGVRKSCSTDADFYAIARYFCEAEQPRQGDASTQFNADLDRISSQGSGDDVSVAIGRWAVAREAPHPSGGRARRRRQRHDLSHAVIVQPSKKQLMAASITAVPLVNSPTDQNGQPNQGEGIVEHKAFEQWWHRRVPWPVVGLVVLAATAIGLSVGKAMLGLEPFTRDSSGSAQPSAELISALLQQSKTLCEPPPRSVQNIGDARDSSNQGVDENMQMIDRPRTRPSVAVDPVKQAAKPSALRERPGEESPVTPDYPTPNAHTNALNNDLTASISERLKPYRSTFRVLSTRQRTPDSFLNTPSKDPLGALIAWNRLHPELEPLPDATPKQDGFLSSLFSARTHKIPQEGIDTSRRTGVVFCPELREALRQLWQSEKPEHFKTPQHEVNKKKPALSTPYSDMHNP